MPLRSGTDHTTPGPAKGARNKGLRPKQPKSAALLEQQRIAALERDDDDPEDATDGTRAEEEGESPAQGGRESQTESDAADTAVISQQFAPRPIGGAGSVRPETAVEEQPSSVAASGSTATASTRENGEGSGPVEQHPGNAPSASTLQAGNRQTVGDQPDATTGCNHATTPAMSTAAVGSASSSTALQSPIHA